MKKKSIVILIVLMLFFVILCGCFDVSKDDSKIFDASIFLGTWEHTKNGTCVAYTNWIFFKNGSLKTIREERYKLPPWPNVQWLTYSIDRNQLCTEYKYDTVEIEKTYYNYTFSDNNQILELEYVIKVDDNWVSGSRIDRLYKEDYDGDRNPIGWFYWDAASDWLSNQDEEFMDYSEKPFFISWITSSFSIQIFGDHPNIGNDLNDMIPPLSLIHI